MTSNPIRQYPGCAISSLGGDECLHWSVYLSGPAAGERPAVSLRADFPLDSSQSIRGVRSFVPFKLKVTGVQSRSQTTVVPSESFRHCISSSILLILPWRWPLWEMKIWWEVLGLAARVRWRSDVSAETWRKCGREPCEDLQEEHSREWAEGTQALICNNCISWNIFGYV